MPDNISKELSDSQLSRANEILSFIPKYIEMGDYNTAVNRSYYAAFHAMKALELLDNFDHKKHSGVIAYFRQHYIKTGIFEKEMSGMIDRLQNQREDSDYNVTIKFDLKNALYAYEIASKFVKEINDYLFSVYDKQE